MEEAQTLCNRIGIITDGVLRTVGTELRLRKIYGSGYYLSISLDIPRKNEVIFSKNNPTIFNSIFTEEELAESI